MVVVRSIDCIFYLHFTIELPSFPLCPNVPLPRSDKVMSGDVLRGAIDFPSNLSSLLLVCNVGRGSHTLTHNRKLSFCSKHI